MGLRQSKCCEFCNEKTSKAEFFPHLHGCLVRKHNPCWIKAVEIGREFMFPEHILKNHQLKAIQYVRKNAEANFSKAIGRLAYRFRGLNLNIDKVWDVLYYVCFEAPVIIHFQEFNLETLLSDTHYRNGHELGRSVNRRQAESQMFSSKSTYFSCPAQELPKYGVMNIFNRPEGVSLCHAYYGRAYFVLSDETRFRTTISRYDSLSISWHFKSFGTCEQFAYILSKYFSDDELVGLVAVVSGEQPKDRLDSCYREVQIHGELMFGRDIVEAVVEKEPSDTIRKLAKEHGMKITLM